MKCSSHKFATAFLIALAGLTARFASAQVIWTGASGTDTNWSDPANWNNVGNPGAVPGAADQVKFFDGGNTNAAGVANNVVDAAFTIASLQYANTNGFHTTLIAPGVTLNVNTNLVGTTVNSGTLTITSAIRGTGGAVLNVSGGNVGVSQGSNGKSILDLSSLDTFNANVGTLGVGAINYPATDSATVGSLILAKTNTLTVSGNTTSGAGTGVQAGFLIGDPRTTGPTSGSSIQLGQTNAIFANLIVVGARKGGASLHTMTFNGAFANSVAFFRAADGASRVPSWSIGDDNFASGGSTVSSGSVDFTGGKVDALVSTLIIGRGQGGAANRGTGTLTFSDGTINVDTLQIGFQSGASAGNGPGTGTMNVNGTATLVVNTSLELGHVTTAGGAAASSSVGTLNVNGGTVRANVITNQGIGNASLSLNSATLIVTNPIVSAGAPLRNFSITNSTLTLPTVTGIASAVTTNLNAGGTSTINISAVPIIASYPATIPLVKYTASSGTFNFNIGTLPAATPAFGGYITNNAASGALNLVLTNGPRNAQALTWSGQIGNGDWDNLTPNWKTNGIGGAVFNDQDFATFNDSAVSNAVSLTTLLKPSAVVVSNSVNYTWSGFGSLSGTFALTKQGSGSLTIANFGNNDFSGGISIEEGTIQIGRADGSGSLGIGSIANNGALIDNRSDEHEIVNAISGGGPLSKIAGGTLILSGANSFTGAVTVTSGTLRANNNSALGSTNGITTIANGATLDVFGKNLGFEQIVAGGIGVPTIGFTNGAIANGGTNQTQALRFVTLTADTAFRTDARLDIRGAPAALLASPPGSPYRISKVGLNQLSLIAVTNVDAGFGDIEILEGTFSVQTTTAQLGNASSNLILRTGATLDLNDLNAHPLNKVITLGDNTIIQNAAGRSVIAGPVTVQGLTTIGMGGTSLVFSNTIGGAGSLNLQTSNTVMLAGGVNTFSGGTYIQSGKLILNCINQNGGLTNFGTLAGNGTNAGPVECNGPLRPGDDAVIGTFGVGDSLYFTFGDVTFDLNTTNTTGGGINDFIDVTGNLTLSGNSIAINVLHGALQPGTYRLIHYGGTLTGTFAGDPAPFGFYSFSLDYSEPKWIKLIVTAGTPSYLTWNSTLNSSWESSLNWSNQNTATTVAFAQGDFVTFDDSVPGVQTAISISSAVFPSGVTNNSATNNYTISGTGKISGLTGLFKTGTNLLTLSTADDFTGTALIREGIVRLGAVAAANTALGDPTVPAIVTNTGTLDLNGFGGGAGTRNLQDKMIIISGPGANDTNGNPLGAINNMSGSRSDNAMRYVTLAGDATLGAAGTANTFSWSIRGLNSDPTTAALSSGGQPHKLTKVGISRLSLFSITVDPALGDIEVKEGQFEMGDNTTGLGNSASNLIVQPGATFQLFANNPPGATTSAWNKVFLLHGDGINPSINVRGGGANTLIGPMQLFGNVIISGSITNRGNITGTGSLTKQGGSTLVLAGVNTYAGDTLISGGTLGLEGSSVISNTAKITVGSGATLDVAARTDAKLTLFNGQTLQGAGTLTGELLAGAGSTVSPGTNSIGALTVSGAATFAGTNFIEINKSSTNDQVFAGGAITYGGVLVLTNLGPAYAAADAFKIFNGPGYTGSFTLSPSTPGAGLTWDTSTLTTDGTLRIAAAGSLPPPTIQRITIGGGNVILSGTNNNGPGGTYHVLTSTNVIQPLTNWAVLTNGSFDGTGLFSSTNAVGGNSRQFYILQVP